MAMVVPGDSLGSTSEMVAGAGCYTAGNAIYASILGVVTMSAAPEGAGAAKVVEVLRKRDELEGATRAAVLPQIGSVVIAKVANINPKGSKVDILSVDGTPVSESFPAIIRSEDVRNSTLDEVQMAACFRPGDYVRGSVISLGSRRDYVLSTAREDLGVVYASLDGVQLAVVDANTMVCPKTKAKESRKVAMAQDSVKS
mmetsp:Transcript_51926/g.75993  ORF Transcript_51926/g.75993 Transcript_51926/m.75993 type:complete len:199 (+) Transcript_51926:13-609(+)